MKKIECEYNGYSYIIKITENDEIKPFPKESYKISNIKGLCKMFEINYDSDWKIINGKELLIKKIIN